jgi:hypothetical protein
MTPVINLLQHWIKGPIWNTIAKMFKINTIAKKVDDISKLTKETDIIKECKEKKIKKNWLHVRRY